MFEAPKLPNEASPPSKLIKVKPAETRPSQLNPRAHLKISISDISLLAAEMKEVGQLKDAHGEYGPDGVVEIVDGLRRSEACALNGMELRVRVHYNAPREKLVAIAHRAENGTEPVSFYDASASWLWMSENGVLSSEAELARAVGVDKSTMSRGLALQKAPTAFLDVFPNRREISQTRWMDFAPLLENEEARALILDRAQLIAGKGYETSRVVAELKAAAAKKEKLDKIDVLNRHGKVIATITPNHRGGFTIIVKSLVEQHPSYRLEFAKMIHEEFVQVLKTFFNDSKA